MLKHTAFALLAASILTAGCDDSDRQISPAAPGRLVPMPAPAFASIDPSFASPQLIRVGGCPDVHPFRVPFNLIIQAEGNLSVTLTEVRIHFIDTHGLSAPPITLPAPTLTRQFGSALVDARSTRTFPLDFSFGCGTGRTGTIIIHVQARDGNGKGQSAEMHLDVR